MNIGFTGTRQGLTEAQFEKLTAILNMFKDGTPVFHHGQCIGADCEAASIAHELGYKIIAHPGFLKKNPAWDGSRGSFDKNDIVLMPKPFLERDHDIDEAADVLIATPAQNYEVLRSGTWATIRYALKIDKMVIIISPDGTLDAKDNTSTFTVYLKD